jgi:serine/threonine protein kinase
VTGPSKVPSAFVAPERARDTFGLVGTVLERQFRVDAVVGEGGFGIVYKGWHLTLDQPIAIKALKMPGAHETKAQTIVLARFREEAKLSYVLSQATLSVVRTIDFGATMAPTGAWVPFAVLEWLDGETLAQDLARRRASGSRGRSLAETMKLLDPAARALAIAHQRRVAHRDIKPGNFFLLATPGGSPIKLLDFGIAKVMADGPDGSTAARTGLLAFTPQYAAPEQIDQRWGETGPWTDVYAFALVLTEVLTDRIPFDASELAGLLVQVTDATRRPTPRALGAVVPDAVEAVCARALAVDPKRRFADASEMWAALEAAGAGPARTAPTPPVASIPIINAPISKAPSGVILGPAPASGSPGSGWMLRPATPPPMPVPPGYGPASPQPYALQPQPHAMPAPQPHRLSPPAPSNVGTWLAVALGAGVVLVLVALAAAALIIHR